MVNVKSKTEESELTFNMFVFLKVPKTSNNIKVMVLYGYFMSSVNFYGQRIDLFTNNYLYNYNQSTLVEPFMGFSKMTN